jgi:hypothetical protein
MRISIPSDNFTGMRSSKSKVEESKSKPSLKSPKGGITKGTSRSIRARKSQAQSSRQPVEDVVQYEGYILALITALVHRHDDVPEKSVDRAETILKLSKAAAVRLHAQREEDEALTFVEFAQLVCGDRNSSRAVASLKELFFEAHLDTLLSDHKKVIFQQTNRDLTSAEAEEFKKGMREDAERRARFEVRDCYKRSEVQGWADSYKASIRKKRGNRNA